MRVCFCLSQAQKSAADQSVAGRRTPSRAETGLLSNTQKCIVRGDTCADKARDFFGKGHPGGEQ